MLTSLTIALSAAAPATLPALVPLPVKMEMRSGMFRMNSGTKVVAPGDAGASAKMLRGYLTPVSGFSFASVRSAKSNRIAMALDKGLERLGPEGYTLTISEAGVDIRAFKQAGLFYGVQTLRQLLPAKSFGRSRSHAATLWEVPYLNIEDSPRFSWRGAMLDPCRHFISMESVYQFVDAMAMHKLNTLHFHLSEDQGWRIEIKKYPKLTEIGAWRRETVIGHNSGKYDGIRHGGFYTQKELKALVKYAAERHITVVPEIDMPGHMVAAIAAYPELGDGQKHEVMREWGVSPHVLNMKDSTVQFCKDVLTEVCAIFPSKFIHVGGDECPKTQWDNDPEEQARLKARGLKDSHELQVWFTGQMDAFLNKKGRRLIGWDEILEGGNLVQSATVMSWRGNAGGIAAAKKGHDVVMAPNSHCYLDYYQGPKATEPDAIGGFVPLDKVYSLNPTPPELSAEEAKHVLGCQGNLWSEYFPNYRHVEYMAFPRLSALAEVGWTPQELRKWKDFAGRLPFHVERLDAMGVNYRRLDPGLGGD